MITVRTDMWPVLVAFAFDELTIDDVDKLKGIMTKVHARGQRFGQLYDARRVKVPSAGVRKALGDLAKHFETETRDNIIRNAVMIDSKILAGALTAVQWMSDNTLPLRYFSTAMESLEWVTHAASDEDVSFPADVVHFCGQLDGSYKAKGDLSRYRRDLLNFGER
jgi:hypothetical protein